MSQVKICEACSQKLKNVAQENLRQQALQAHLHEVGSSLDQVAYLMPGVPLTEKSIEGLRRKLSELDSELACYRDPVEQAPETPSKAAPAPSTAPKSKVSLEPPMDEEARRQQAYLKYFRDCNESFWKYFHNTAIMLDEVSLGLRTTPVAKLTEENIKKLRCKLSELDSELTFRLEYL